MWDLRSGLWVVAGAALLVGVAACGGKGGNGESSESSVPHDGGDGVGSSVSVELSTVPTRTGSLVLSLGDETYDLTVDICVLDPGGLEFLAYAEERDEPVRVEYSDVQGGQLVVAVDPVDVVDPGSETWVGTPVFELSAAEAVAGSFTVTNGDGETADAVLEVSCPQVG